MISGISPVIDQLTVPPLTLVWSTARCCFAGKGGKVSTDTLERITEFVATGKLALDALSAATATITRANTDAPYHEHAKWLAAPAPVMVSAMATIYTPHTVFATVAAAQKVAEANADDGDGWEYRVAPDLRGSGKAIIEIYDETGDKIGRL